MIKLPTEFSQRMKKLLGDEYEAFENALNNESVKAFRVNTDKISLEDFSKINVFGSQRLPYAETGFYLEYEKAGNHPYHHAGMIYIQEPSAMAPAECINIEKGWNVLDLCAAPGGKSTQLKNKIGENGLLVSNEIIASRCKILAGNIERLGLKNTIVTCSDTKRLCEKLCKSFDLIMLDAPCSGEGMFRKEQRALDEWSYANVKMCASRQAEILGNAVTALKDGGYIIYSTCTYSLEENEMVIDAFLKNHSDFEIVKVSERVEKCSCDGIMFDGCECKNMHYARRFYPHKNKGEGQFAAVLHNKNEKTANDNRIVKKKQKVSSCVFDFLDDVLVSYDKNAVMQHGDKVYYFTANFDESSVNPFLQGITVGEVKKDFIKPHHQFFSAMGASFKNKVNFSADSEDLKKYLHGEEIEVSCENGWAAVTVDGCALGGIKVSGKKAKNHYPKGLRTK